MNKIYKLARTKGKPIFTYCEYKKKEVLVGYLIGKVLYKLVKSNSKRKGKGNHFFVKYRGYGIQSTVFSFLEGQCDKIVLISNETKNEWHIDFDNWKQLPDIKENAGSQKVYETVGVPPTVRYV